MIWWSLWYRGSPVCTVLISDVPGLVQFVNSTKVKKKMHFENLIDQFLAFIAESVPNCCMRFPFAQKLHNPGIFVWAFVLSCLWLRGKLFSTSFSTNCVMSTLSDSFDSCNYTKRNHNLSDYEKKGGSIRTVASIVSESFSIEWPFWYNIVQKVWGFFAPKKPYSRQQ